MTEKITNIAKNTSYFTIALILQKVISFTYFTLIARALGPEDLGKYYFAISFTTIFAILIDLGMANVLTREIARFKKNPDKLLGLILTVKIPLAIITWLLLFITMNILGYGDIIKYLIYLSSISMILDSFTATFFAVSRGFHNLFYESIASVLFQMIILSAGLLVLKLNLGLIWLMTAVTLASTFNFIYSTLLLRKKFGLIIWPHYDKTLLLRIVKITIPFALYGVLQRLYTYFDSILLNHFAGSKYVGIYQIAFKIIFALQFLPLAFTATLYPAMSAYWASNRAQLGITFERAMKYLIIISLPIAVGIAAIADKIIIIFKSGYQEAVLPLQINMLALIFIFICFPIGSILNACDRQKTNTINMAITVIFSIILNLILIPKFQAVGASITVVATNFLMFLLGMYFVPKIINYRPWSILKIFMKSFAAVLIMVLLTFYLKNVINIVFTVIISGFAYFTLLYLFKAVSKKDVISVYQSFVKKETDPGIEII